MKKLKVIGVNAAGLMSKMDSFEKLLVDEQPSIFCIQETKLKKENRIKTESTKKFTIYELNRKDKNGGGLCIGVLKDLHPAWVAQGDDDVECLSVEVWVEGFPIRVVTGYGPQVGDSYEKKMNFWNFIEREALNAFHNGSGFILQMDSNSHLGQDIIDNDPNPQNSNGKLFCQFLERLPHLTLINTMQLCDGLITRMRKTTNGVEKSILDVFITCHRILPYISKMTIDENRQLALTNYSKIKKVGKVTESDHNVEILELNLEYSRKKTDRVEVFQFKDKNAQALFKDLTTKTTEFSKCFENDLNFEEQANNWKKVLKSHFYKAFKKVRVSNKNRIPKSEIQELMEKRKTLRKRNSEDTDDTIDEIDHKIAEICQEENRKKIMENFGKIDGFDGFLSHHGFGKLNRNSSQK